MGQRSVSRRRGRFVGVVTYVSGEPGAAAPRVWLSRPVPNLPSPFRLVGGTGLSVTGSVSGSKRATPTRVPRRREGTLGSNNKIGIPPGPNPSVPWRKPREKGNPPHLSGCRETTLTAPDLLHPRHRRVCLGGTDLSTPCLWRYVPFFTGTRSRRRVSYVVGRTGDPFDLFRDDLNLLTHPRPVY